MSWVSKVKFRALINISAHLLCRDPLPMPPPRCPLQIRLILCDTLADRDPHTLSLSPTTWPTLRLLLLLVISCYLKDTYQGKNHSLGWTRDQLMGKHRQWHTLSLFPLRTYTKTAAASPFLLHKGHLSRENLSPPVDGELSNLLSLLK